MHSLVVDKLMRMQLVDAMVILNWFFSSKVTPLYTHQYIWDILDATILKTNRAHIQATKDLAETNEKLKKVGTSSLIPFYPFLCDESAVCTDIVCTGMITGCSIVHGR